MLFNKFSERIKAASGGGIAGIPGGSTGQALVKASGTDYDYVWTSIPGTFTISEGNYVYFAYAADDIQINVDEMTATSGGVVPTPPNDSSYFLDGTGMWSIPASGAGPSPTETRVGLSGSTNGAAFTVSSISAISPMTVHTSISGTTNWDDIWIWAINTYTSSVTLSLYFGGHSSVGDMVVHDYDIPAGGLPILICPGLFIQNSGVVEAYASVANKINLIGYVNRCVV